MLFWGVPILILLASLGMIYLHLQGTCDRLGREIKQLEAEREDIRKRVVNEERNWMTARSIRNMEAMMERHGIVMSWPEEANIIRLRVLEEEPEVEAAVEYAARVAGR